MTRIGGVLSRSGVEKPEDLVSAEAEGPSGGSVRIAAFAVERLPAGVALQREEVIGVGAACFSAGRPSIGGDRLRVA